MPAVNLLPHPPPVATDPWGTRTPGLRGRSTSNAYRPKPEAASYHSNLPGTFFNGPGEAGRSGHSGGAVLPRRFVAPLLRSGISPPRLLPRRPHNRHSHKILSRDAQVNGGKAGASNTAFAALTAAGHPRGLFALRRDLPPPPRRMRFGLHHCRRPGGERSFVASGIKKATFLLTKALTTQHVLNELPGRSRAFPVPGGAFLTHQYIRSP